MDDKTTVEMSVEDRLKAIVYQFILLHDRWSEERQVVSKQGADMAALLKHFTEQVKTFKDLEPQVRKSIVANIQQTMKDVTETVSEDIVKSAAEATKDIAKALDTTVKQTQYTLQAYQAEIKNSQWKTIGLTIFTTIASCLLLVKFLIPAPTLPLTDQQINDLQGGQIMRIVWPTLSKDEKKRWLKLVDQVEHPKNINVE